MCMCCCNPSPLFSSMFFLMYINPDSRGQCVLGEVILLSYQSIASNFHSSACGPHSGPEMCVLLFQRQAVHLELIRGTHTGPGGLDYTCMSVYMLFFNLCTCVHLYLCERQSVFSFSKPPFTMGCNICHAVKKKEKKKKKPCLTDRSTNSTTGQLIVSREMSISSYCQTAYVCVISLWDRLGCRWG